MGDLFWEPVDIETEITSLGRGSSFFLQKATSKTLLLVHEADVTCVTVFTHDETGLKFNYSKIIQSTSEVLKITGNNNCIVMLDGNEELFYLQLKSSDITVPLNPFTADEFLDSQVQLSWHRLHQLTNCLGMIGVTDAIIFLYHNESLYAATYRTSEIESGLSESSCERIDGCTTRNGVFGAVIRGSIVNDINSKILKHVSPCRELILIMEESQLLFSKPTTNGQILSQPCSIDFKSNSVISVMAFDRERLILATCKTGKLVCLKFPCKSSKTFHSSHLWLPKKVSAITGYEDDGIVLLWSDLIDLNVSKLTGDELVHLKVVHNVRGIRHFARSDDDVLAFTRNGCLYKTRISRGKSQTTAVTPSTNDVLNRIYKIGNEVEALNEESDRCEELLAALEISKLSSMIRVTGRGKDVTVENKTNLTFKKNLWKVKLKCEDFHRSFCEIKSLDKDILPGASTLFQWDNGNCRNLSVTLMCEVRRDAIILVNPEVNNSDDVPQREDSALTHIERYLQNNFNFVA